MCHANNIVHRDLKPENLLLDGKGPTALIKVIDFGTSMVFDPGMRMKQTYGTPYYIAPEVIRGSYDAKCDMWSCGVILYILLSGRPPFDGKNDSEILKAVEKSAYHFNYPQFKTISKEAIDLVKKLLDPNAAKRIAAKDSL